MHRWLTIALWVAGSAEAWVTPAAQRRAGARVRLHAGSGPHEGTPTASGTSSRRTLLNKVVALPAVVAATVAPRGAYAKGGPASPAELKRMKDGYDGLNYLLDPKNFETLTTKCNPECNRYPDAIRSYLGLRSMDHPLYQIEKVMSKAQDNLEDVDLLEDYIQAVEDYQNAVSNSNGLSYTSSFGEYNPGGGKDAVEKYLILSAKEAQTARDCLGRILKTLGQI